MAINTRGMQLVKHFEGLRLEAYRDPVGVWTIGYGHTGSDVYSGKKITRDEAEHLLQDDLAKHEAFVKTSVKVNLNPDQLAAVTSFAFNAGDGNLEFSTLLRKLNKNDYGGAAEEFPRWVFGTVHGKKVKLEGLARRRRAERALFLGQELPLRVESWVVSPDAVPDDVPIEAPVPAAPAMAAPAAASIEVPLTIRIEMAEVHSASASIFAAPSAAAEARVANSERPLVARQSSAQLGDLMQGKAELRKRFLSPRMDGGFRAMSAGTSPDPMRNVVGVAVAEKESEGVPTGLMSVKLLVRLKYAKGSIPAGHMLPEEINGVPVDVEEVGQIRPYATFPNPRQTITPVLPGCSIGFELQDPLRLMAGTLGAFVTDATGRTFILSNNHVLADEGRLQPGAPIYQTGLLDLPQSQQRRRIATLDRFVPLNQAPLKVDAALASVDNPALMKTDVLYIGAPQGANRAVIDAIVHKFGRTTGYTVGRIKSVAADITVGYETGDYLFEDQILIVGMNQTTFSDSGDSGSLILERPGNHAVGLLFAGSPSHTIANHIGDVLSALNVQLA